jgi:hypothetical protein
MTLDETRQHVGRRVTYRPWPSAAPELWERGTITSVGEVWCFVRYGADQHGKATNPNDLELE